MNDIKYNDFQIEKISKAIEEARSVLNEVCSDSDDYDSEARLNISRYLDELIVEYLRQIKKRDESTNT
jgi:hypothetical protein